MIIKRYCKNCNKELSRKNGIYCTKECMIESCFITLNCIKCNKEFIYHRINDDLDILKNRHCSKECQRRKNSLNENYFNEELTNEKIIILGKIIVCGWHSNPKKLHIISDMNTINDINDKLGSDYKPKKSQDGLYHLIMFSEKLVNSLIILGLGNNPMYQELPFYDFDLLLEGIKQSHVYTNKDNIIYTLRSSRLALELSIRFKDAWCII